MKFTSGDFNTMTKTLQTALSPLLITGAFCGLGFFEYPLGRPRVYLSCLYFLILWGLYVYLCYYVIEISNHPRVLNWTNLVLTFTSVVSMFVNLFRFKALKKCLHRISIVNDTLEILGTPKDYRCLYKWMIRVVIVWIVLSLLSNIIDILIYNSNLVFNIVRICTPFLLNYWIHVNTIMGLTWGTILGYTASKFEQLNKHIRNLLEISATPMGKRDKLIQVNQRKRNAKEIEEHIWIMMHVHLQLSLISRELNKVFGTQMTLEMASLFMILLDQFIDFYNLYVDDTVNILFHVLMDIVIYLWMIIFTAKILVLNYICQMVCDNANETIAILYQLSNNNADEELREQTVQFILQIKQRQVKFSGMGLFYFGNSFVRKFFKYLVTVLVIIIQMRTSNTHLSDTLNEKD